MFLMRVDRNIDISKYRQNIYKLSRQNIHILYRKIPSFVTMMYQNTCNTTTVSYKYVFYKIYNGKGNKYFFLLCILHHTIHIMRKYSSIYSSCLSVLSKRPFRLIFFSRNAVTLHMKQHCHYLSPSSSWSVYQVQWLFAAYVHLKKMVQLLMWKKIQP